MTGIAPPKGGQPSFSRVMRTVERLHAHQVPFSALCAVNSDNSRQPLKVYRFLRDEVAPRLIQFTPVVEPIDFRQSAPHAASACAAPKPGDPRAKPSHPEAPVTPWSVGPEQWGRFLCAIWNEWFQHDFGKVFVDQFENTISQMLGQGAQKCVTAPTCGKAIAIEHDGSLYSCDHFVYPEFQLGNILDHHEGDLAFSEQQVAFGMGKANSLPAYCRACRHLDLCWGECPKNRILATPQGEPGLNWLCSGMRAFYDLVTRTRPRIERHLTQKS